MSATECQKMTADRDLRHVVLGAHTQHIGLVHNESELAGGNPLLDD